LLVGHSTSQRLSGRFIETIVSLDHLTLAGIDFPGAPIALIPTSNLPPPSITGGVGLPLFANFQLITVDYPHDRLLVTPTPRAKPSIPKDRLGLVLDRNDTTTFSVAFVSPNSPAAAAGFQKGDHIALIDGRPFTAWPTADIIKFPMAAAGTTHTVTMPGGTVRHLTAADFF
jgi:membrane-associated protease RseP (regulator of RpoE activity)